MTLRIKRLILALLFLTLLMPSLSWSAVTHVRSNCQTGITWTGSPGAYTWTYATATPANGNLSVFVQSGESRYLDTAAGTGMTYARTGSAQHNATAGNWATQLYAIANGTDTTATLTLNGAYGGADQTVCYMEFTGIESNQSGRTSNGSVTNTSTTHNSGSVTPPTAANVVIANHYISSNDATQDGDFTMLTTGSNSHHAGYFIQAAATAQEFNATTGGSRFSAMVIGAYAGTAAAARNFFSRRLVQ